MTPHHNRLKSLPICHQHLLQALLKRSLWNPQVQWMSNYFQKPFKKQKGLLRLAATVGFCWDYRCESFMRLADPLQPRILLRETRGHQIEYSQCVLPLPCLKGTIASNLDATATVIAMRTKHWKQPCLLTGHDRCITTKCILLLVWHRVKNAQSRVPLMPAITRTDRTACIHGM